MPPASSAGIFSRTTIFASGSISCASTAAAAPAYDKSIQPISVSNASAVVGRSLGLIQTLASAGYTSAWQLGDLPAAAETKVLYGTDMADVAADVAALFKIPADSVTSDPTINGVSIVVGTDWASGTEFGKITVPEDIVASTADQGGECLSVNPLYYTK